MARNMPPDKPTEHRLTALVPMRHHSERVPEKNFRDLAGRPLYAHILGVLLATTSVEHIVVDTDSPVIKAGIRDAFPKVTVLDRPAELAAPEVPMNDIIAWDISQVPGDHFLQTHSTNPLLQPATVDRAVEMYFSGLPGKDSLFSVTRLQKRLWNLDGTPVNHDPAELLQTQKLPIIYEENSCLYVFQRRILQARRNRIGQNPVLFEIPVDEAWDIDEMADFEIAAAMLGRRAPSGG
jgi:CMP-N-acetylneuraminic acid synthetase